MELIDVCESYFSGFRDIYNFRNNDSCTNSLAVLKIISYFTVLIPLVFAVGYGAASLSGRVSKTNHLSSSDTKVHELAKKNVAMHLKCI